MGLEVVELARLVQQHVGGWGGGSRSGGGQVQGHVAKQALRKLKEKTKETNAISAASETLAAERESDLQSFRSSNAQLRVDNHAASRLFFLLSKKNYRPAVEQKRKMLSCGSIITPPPGCCFLELKHVTAVN
jgi:hypothetical protein